MLEDGAAQGNIFVYGGTMEGVANIGLTLKNTRSPSMVAGVHFEANGIADVVLDNTRHVQLIGIFTQKLVRIINDGEGNKLDTSIIDSIEFAAIAYRTRIENLTYRITGVGTIQDDSPDTAYTNVATATAGHVDWFNTHAIGTINPNSNPVGLTPNRKMDIEGVIQVQLSSASSPPR